MLTLRPYQDVTVQKIYDALRNRDDNPCAVLPTGGGKSLVLAKVCRDVFEWGGRALITAHVKELLEQTADKIRQYCPEVPFGLYSAGLGKREKDAPIVIAGIQSVAKLACDLGAFDLILVDEAHLIPPDGEGRYRQFLTDAKVVNPHVRVVGLTATPFRLQSGNICTPDNFLNHVCHEVSVGELIVDGYLSPLVTKAGVTRFDISRLHRREGEFIPAEVKNLMDQDELVQAACQEIVALTQDRRSVLIFASGIEHALHVQRVLREQHGASCGFVCGLTPTCERDETLTAFKNGWLHYLCNVDVLTTGFDAPATDCVVLLRPTLSPGLYYQMVGRGFRLAPGKRNCLVLDFGGNIVRHGTLDQLRVEPQSRDGNGTAPAKECPECHCVIAAGCGICPECQYVFPPPERQKHEARAAEVAILSDQETEAAPVVDEFEYEVLDTQYCLHRKKNAAENAPPTLRAKYRVGVARWISEYVCFEHPGYARRKAIAWWKARSPDAIPDSVDRALELVEGGALCITHVIRVRSKPGAFDEILRHDLGAMPEPIPVTDDVCLEGVPF